MLINGILCHSLGGAVIFLSLQHFIAPALDLMNCLPSLQKREAIKACNSLWLSFEKRAKLDLRLTKLFFEHHFMNVQGTDVVPGAVVGNHCTRHGSSRCIMPLEIDNIRHIFIGNINPLKNRRPQEMPVPY